MKRLLMAVVLGACAWFGQEQVALAQKTSPAPAAPVAHPETYGCTWGGSLVDEKPGVLGNDTRGVGDILHAELVDIAKHPGPVCGLHPWAIPQPCGTLKLRQDGSFIWTPTKSFTGVQTFRYRACRGSVCSAPAQVTIRSSHESEVPVARWSGRHLEPTRDGATFGMFAFPYEIDASPSTDPSGAAITSHSFSCEGADRVTGTGVTTTSPKITHLFQVAGAYHCSLRVMNANGVSSKVVLVFVQIKDETAKRYESQKTPLSTGGKPGFVKGSGGETLREAPVKARPEKPTEERPATKKKKNKKNKKKKLKKKQMKKTTAFKDDNKS